MKNSIYVDGSNYFNKEDLEEMIKLLEDGKTIEVGIDCIGHTRNNMVQEEYKEALIEHFEDKLEVKQSAGLYSYSYIYKLK